MAKNLILGAILACLAHIWTPIFCVDFTSSGSWTLFQAIILCNV